MNIKSWAKRKGKEVVDQSVFKYFTNRLDEIEKFAKWKHNRY